MINTEKLIEIIRNEKLDEKAKMNEINNILNGKVPSELDNKKWREGCPTDVLAYLINFKEEKLNG